MSYSAFARFYDSLMRGVDYEARADYVCRALARFGREPGLTLDLACGTGSLTLALAARGLDVYGLDASPEMLAEAQRKAAAAGRELLFVCQKMQQMDLFGGADTMVCALDSVNHLTKPQLEETFRRVRTFLNPGGYFLFDANTLYKHREILADNVFVYDLPDVYCVWQNRSLPRSGSVGVSLDFFERCGDVYRRSSEHFAERAYSPEALRAMLEQAGLRVKAVWEDGTFAEPSPKTERLFIAAEKPQNEEKIEK